MIKKIIIIIMVASCILYVTVASETDKDRSVSMMPQQSPIAYTPEQGSRAECTLQKHSGTTQSFWSGYETGMRVVTYFDPNDCGGATIYPFAIEGLAFTLYDAGGYQWPVDVDIVIYDVDVSEDPCDGPGAELFRTSLSCEEADFSLPNIGLVTFGSPCHVMRPFFIGIEYNDDGSGPFPSVLFDNNSPAPLCENWQYHTDNNWYEWNSYWNPPAPGYPIYWVEGETDVQFPLDFYIEVHTGSNAPWGVRQFISIDSAGNAQYYALDVETDSSDEASFVLTASELWMLHDAVFTTDFFSLDSLYESGLVDGSATTLVVSSDGYSNEVFTINFYVAGVHEVVDALNRILESYGIFLSTGSASDYSEGKEGR